jgi:SpoVK/Ycf46/Vps4 family AAA+-type ATPase
MARGAVPVLRVSGGETPTKAMLPQFDDFPWPVVLCTSDNGGMLSRHRPLISVDCSRLTPTALRDMWQKTVPALANEADVLAARFPVEPWHALQVAADLESTLQYNGAAVCLDDVSSSIRGRAVTNLEGGVRLIRPEATWDHLVLPEQQLKQLQEAVSRLYMQGRVLDDWRFLEGRRGARGVRMLFVGPPGTGKTLSAEVLASTLDVDLLQVDISRVVSKWIGETEKNLARVFETAERAKAVLLFDEADALFGKRTEVSDAHDRYANLETAYLLSRLERFEGLAILSTNLRQNIDAAFTRRLEFIVDFAEPPREQRLALWKCHLPKKAPLAADVQLDELAGSFAIVGGLIRNAAVAAAFLAAAEDSAISQVHFINAIRREYEKCGKPYRELVEKK